MTRKKIPSNDKAEEQSCPEATRQAPGVNLIEDEEIEKDVENEREEVYVR